MDSELLGKLIDRHADALVLFARVRCDTPEDVVQEAFLKLVGLQTMPSDVCAWLYRAVRNGSINAAKAAGRRKRHESQAGASRTAWFAPPSLHSSENIDPEAATESARVAAGRRTRSGRRAPLGRAFRSNKSARFPEGRQALCIGRTKPP